MPAQQHAASLAELQGARDSLQQSQAAVGALQAELARLQAQQDRELGNLSGRLQELQAVAADAAREGAQELAALREELGREQARAAEADQQVGTGCTWGLGHSRLRGGCIRAYGGWCSSHASGFDGHGRAWVHSTRSAACSGGHHRQS